MNNDVSLYNVSASECYINQLVCTYINVMSNGSLISMYLDDKIEEIKRILCKMSIKCHLSTWNLKIRWRQSSTKAECKWEKKEEKITWIPGPIAARIQFNSSDIWFDIGGPFFSECYRAEKEGLLLLIWARKLEAANGCWKIRIIPSVNAPAAVAPAVTVGGPSFFFLLGPDEATI